MGTNHRRAAVFTIATGIGLMGAALAHPVKAGPAECRTSIDAISLHLTYDAYEESLAANRSRREAWVGGWGAITCPGYVTLRHLTPDLTDEERQAFCLQYDPAQKTYLGYAYGERDAWLDCKAPGKSFCQRVKGSQAAARQITGYVARQPDAAGAQGVTVASEGTAAVVSGSRSYLRRALEPLGTSAMAVLATPTGLAATAVTVVAVGGAVYVCSD